MNSIQQTRFIAQNYPFLQGLRSIPSGLLLLAITLWANLQHGPARDLTLPLLIALGCLVLYILIDQYYNRAFGRVKRAIFHAEMFLQVVCAILALGAFIIDTTDHINISLLGLVFAVIFASGSFWYWRPVKVLFISNLSLAVFMALLSLLPVVGIRDWWSIFGLKHSLLAFSFLFGAFCVISGVVSHIYFVRSLPAIQEAS